MNIFRRQIAGKKDPCPIFFISIGLLALLLRFLYLWEIWGTDAFVVLTNDAKAYDAWARRIAAGDWLGNGVFYQAPLYPYLLGIFYKVTGFGHEAARIIQAAAGASACLLVAGAGSRFFGRRVGFVAGVFMAVYPTAIFFDGIVQKASMSYFFTALLLFLLGGVISRKSNARHWFAIGAVLGLLGLVRENALILIFPCLLWAIVRWKHNIWPDAVARAGLLAIGMIAVLAPVGLRNLAVGGEFAITTSQFGPNFYIGNRPGGDGSYAPLVPGRGDPFFERNDAILLAERAEGRSLSSGEVSRFWTKAALQNIADNPHDWLFVMGRKALLTASRYEEPDTEDQYVFCEWSLLLRRLTSLFHFGVLLPLATFGMVISWPWRRRIWVLYVFLAAYVGTMLIFYVFSRYRFPLVPALTIFSAFGLLRGIRLVRRRQYKRLFWPALAALAAAAAANLAAPPDLAAARANVYFNIGSGLTARPGRVEDAVGYFEEAIRLQPESSLPYRGMGDALMQLGNAAKAESYYLKAVDLQPDSPDIYVSLGDCYMELRNYPNAVSAFGNSLSRDPSLEHPRHKMGAALIQMGRMNEALEIFRETIQLAPLSAAAHFYYGSALLDAGKPETAIKELEQSIALSPDVALAHRRLAQGLSLLGRKAEASREFRLAEQLDRSPAAGR